MRRESLFCPLLCVVLCTVLVACVLGSSRLGIADEPPAAKEMVEVKLWVFEVNITKLRNVGFDWDATFSRSFATDSAKLLAFLTALEQDNVARVISKPMISTGSGRKAWIEISNLKVEVTPTVVDDEHIGLEYRFEREIASEAQPDKAGRRFVTAYSTELKSGAVQLLSETKAQHRRANGEHHQTRILVLAQATTAK